MEGVGVSDLLLCNQSFMLMEYRLPNSSCVWLLSKPKHTQTVIDATQKETAIDQQQNSREMMVCESHQTILRLLSSAPTACTCWRVRELYCLTTHTPISWICLQIIAVEVGKVRSVDRQVLDQGFTVECC